MVDDPSSTSLHGNLKLLLFNSIVEIAVTPVNLLSHTAYHILPSFYSVRLTVAVKLCFLCWQSTTQYTIQPVQSLENNLSTNTSWIPTLPISSDRAYSTPQSVIFWCSSLKVVSFKFDWQSTNTFRLWISVNKTFLQIGVPSKSFKYTIISRLFYLLFWYFGILIEVLHLEISYFHH